MSNREVATRPVDLSVALSTSAGNVAVEQAAAFGVVPEHAWLEGEAPDEVEDPWLAFVMASFEPRRRRRRSR